jgi:DNA-binding winged helix-turn-helix (wHTH) protein/tetratricopeptide (TPR) repeat protein
VALPFTFGDFELDPRLCTLRESGRPVTVQPKVFDLLLYLVEHHDRVVPKEELLSAVWRQVTVEESSLTRAVNLARLALHDDGRAQRWIQTLPRRGYRFVAPVAERTRPDAGPPAPRAEEARSGGTAFVGREGVMTRLEGALRLVLAGQGRSVAICGEPGIGKTRTLEELVTRARSRGADAHLAWCLEGEGAPPYWPWVQILRAHVRERGPEGLRGRADPAAELVALLPELGAAVDGAAPAARAVPEERRFRLYQSLASGLRRAAGERPLVLIFDDVHWSDPSSLRLIEFIAREIRWSPVLLVVAYREDALDEAHPLRATLARLARQGGATRITLQGLTRQDVGRLVEALAGVAPGDRLVEAIHERTAGNPFFVQEIVLSLAADGRLQAGHVDEGLDPEVPPAVRDVIGQRLLALGPECGELLRAAAVIGPEFELPVLLAVTQSDEARAIALLDAARRSQLLQELPSRAGSYRFRHALVQETLYADVGQAARARMHRRIGEALIARYGEDSEAHAAALAYHFCRGAQRGEEERAVRFAQAAGRRAMRLLAYEEAARHYGRALEALALAASPDDALRAQLLIEQGRAFMRGGDGERAEAVLGRAAGLARSLHCADLLSSAALTLAGATPTLTGLSPAAAGLLEEALEVLGEADLPLRVKMLCRLCAHLSAAGRVERAASVGDGAVDLAARVADPALRVAALNARNSVRLLDEGPEARCRRARQAIALATGAGLHGPPRESRLQLAAALLEAGDLPGVEEALAAYTEGAPEDPPDLRTWYGALSRAMRLALAGHFTQAEAASEAALAIGRRLHHPDAMLYFGFQRAQIRYLQGRVDELRDGLAGIVDGSSHVPGLRALMALVDSESGRVEEARSELERFAAADFEELPRDAGYVSNLSLLALVCAAVGDAAVAERLAARLEPMRGRNVCALVVTSNGAVEHFLGLLALRAGRMEHAVADLRTALARNQHMGALPWVLHGRLALARALRCAGDGGLESQELVASALEGARRLGMRRLAEDAARCLASAAEHPA